MNNEMKEILDKLRSTANSKMDFTYTIIQKLEAKSLYNYITNLQEENKVLLEKYSTIQILYNSSKLKNDKAIEYINEWLDGKNNDDIIIAMNSLGNILQGGDK